MSDELYYERLAIEVARSWSPLPRVHGVSVPNLNQLYPVLIAPFYGGDALVPEALHRVHVFDAFVMTSAAIPAFLLARRVTRSAWLAGGVAFLTVAAPWIVYSSSLLTEVVAYPAFLWAVLGIERAIAAPSVRRDVLALAGIALAVSARTQFVVLLAVLPVALALHALALAEGRRVHAASRMLLAHRALVWAYGLLLVGALALWASGGLSRSLGTYRAAGEGDVLPPGLPRSSLEHLTAIGLAVGVLPFLVGGGWALSRLARPRDPERTAFASVALVTVLALALEIASFDLRFAGGSVSDRYLFYVVPVVVAAFAAALADPPWPRWALLSPAALVAVGCALLPLPVYEKVNFDRPLALGYEWVRDAAGSVTTARVLLAAATVVLAVLFVESSLLLGRRVVALVAALPLLVLPVLAAGAFVRFLDVTGTSGRPVTLDQGVVFDWIDRAVGKDAKVTMVPYPVVPSDYWAGTAYWWDLEFWNASVVGDVVHDGRYYVTSTSFPKTGLSFDRRTGRASASPTPYAAQAQIEARFRIAGERLLNERGLYLIRAEEPWRAEWLTRGLFDDGWTRPGRVAAVRVFARPGDATAVSRSLTLQLRAPSNVPPRPYAIRVGERLLTGTAVEDTRSVTISLCVPPHRFVDVELEVGESSPIYGDPLNSITIGHPRQAGVQLLEIALADEVGPTC